MADALMTEKAAPSKGTRPEGATNEADASRKVREMFTQIAPRYDLLNHVLSLQLDRVWRARAARRLRRLFVGPEGRIKRDVLDLCCGTGDLAIELHNRYWTQMTAVDFSHTMLIRAKEKGARLHSKDLIQLRPILLVEADGLKLPFADGSFDLVTAAFGFRNLANYEAGLREMQRVLKPGGTIGILEFTEPPAGFFGDFYRWYFRNVLPKIGGAISGDAAAYKYLPNSVARFFQPAELCELMRGVGLQNVEAAVWTGGTVALHTGIKQ